MTKDKDGDDPKDNVLKFPSKPKESDNDPHYHVTIESFSPEELHARMSDLDKAYEKCFHYTKAIEFQMHEYHTELELDVLESLESELKELFLKYIPTKG